MNEGKISVRYARALYAQAEEMELHQEIYLQLEKLTEAFIQVEGLSRTLANPMHGKDEKVSLLLHATGCKPDSLLADFFRFVTERGREEFMPFIAMSYQRIYRERQRIVVGRITSALPLKDDSVEKIRQLVDRRFAASIELSTEVEPDILGGFILEVDNYRMDSSVRSELERIKAELLRD